MDFLMVTFLKRIESKGKVEGEIGVLSKKIERAIRSEGSWKAEFSQGLDDDIIGRGTVFSGGDKGE